MTIGAALAWIAFGVAMFLLGESIATRFGRDPLLMLNRGLLHIRAAEKCARLSCEAAGIEWRRQYSECLRWARSNQ